MSLGTAGGAVAQFLLIAIIGWVVVDLILKRVSRDEIGLVERALLSVTGFVAFSVALMLLNIVTGGAAFGIPGVVPLLTLALVGLGIKNGMTVPRIPWRWVLPATILLFLLFVVPVAVGGSSARTGDPPWHLGWTEQLLGGDPVPSGPAPEFGRNAYPWGLHAVMATMVRLVPGTTPLVALEALHLVVVAAIPLAAAALARRLHLGAGWLGAGAAALIGGFGWVSAGSPDFITSPSEARYGADLVVASPNAVYELFPSASPRELGLALLGAAGLLIVVALHANSKKLLSVASVAIGLVGLMSVPMFVSALTWAVVGVLFLARENRWRVLARLLGPGIAVFALWAGPVAAGFVRYDGFVNITPQLGKEWPLPIALASWGLLLPLAAAGLWLALRSQGTAARALLVFAGTTTVLMGVAVARGRFDWNLAGNATLLHQGRVWPVAHLLGAAFAGFALMRAYEFLNTRKRAVALLVPVAVLGLGAVSPAFATVRLTEVIQDDDAGFYYARADLEPGSFVREAATRLDPDDVVLVEGDRELASLLWQFSGCRLADYDDPRLEGNELRIRYEELARRWDEQMASGGFEADYIVRRASVEGALVTGEYEGRAYSLLDVGVHDRV